MELWRIMRVAACMQYVIYVLVATPLVLGWLFWASATTPPQPPMYDTGLNAIADEAPRPAKTAVVKAVAANDKKAAAKSG